jgi:NitT/TauT family transport system permease protein
MRGVLFRYAPLFLLAAAWEASSRLGLVSSSTLPPLSEIARAWIELAASGDLVSNGLASLYRLAVGLGLAIVIGGVLGLAMARSGALDALLRPFMELLYPLPKSALIPVTALWLGFGSGSKILLVCLGCLLPVVVGAYNGARSADRMLIWSARSMGASAFRIMIDVVVPSALPELLSGVRTALALSFVLLISSELIVSQSGFGYLIGFLGSSGTYAPMFAVVMTVALLGFAADRGFQMIMRRSLRWRS